MIDIEFEVKFEIDDLADIWVLTCYEVSYQITRVDKEHNIWEISNTQPISKEIKYYGRYKSLETALGEAILLVSDL